MKIVLFVLLLLAGCGGGDPDTEVNPEPFHHDQLTPLTPCSASSPNICR